MLASTIEDACQHNLKTNVYLVHYVEASTVTSLYHLHGRAWKHVHWPFLSWYTLRVMCVDHNETTWVGSLKIQCMSVGGGEKQTMCCIDNCMEYLSQVIELIQVNMKKLSS